jgi:hypothetical protein
LYDRSTVLRRLSARSACAYSIIFETPVIPDKFSVLRKYPNAPHPFVLVPPLDRRTTIPAGANLELGVTLIGRGIDYLPHFIRVFDSMGRNGRYGGPFRIRSVISALEPKTTIYDAATRRFVAEPLLAQPSVEQEEIQRLSVDFLTPLRIRTGGRYNLRPDFVAITHALLRRIHLLSSIYRDDRTEEDHTWMHELLRKADQVQTRRADFKLYEWDRASGRQGRRVQMDGVLGSLEAEGDLTDLAPYFKAGVWLSVGSGTSMGLGKYRISEESLRRENT